MPTSLSKEPPVAVIIATRNRGDSIIVTLESLLACTYSNYEIIVVDQSPGNETEQAVATLMPHPKLRYCRSDTVGKGRAINFGLSQTDRDVICLTDDDCIVPENWISVFADIFVTHPRVSVAYCNVIAAPHDASAGFVPDYVRESNQLVRTMPQKLMARGIGAGMAIRREAIIAGGGYDAMMGPGGYFPSAADRDMAIRAIIQGWWVYETVDTSVEHFGFRTWEQGRELTKRDWRALGAMCAKPVKARHKSSILLLLWEGFFYGFFGPVFDSIRMRRLHGFRRFFYFWKGFFEGMKLPMDNKTLIYSTD